MFTQFYIQTFFREYNVNSFVLTADGQQLILIDALLFVIEGGVQIEK